MTWLLAFMQCRIRSSWLCCLCAQQCLPKHLKRKTPLTSELYTVCVHSWSAQRACWLCCVLMDLIHACTILGTRKLVRQRPDLQAPFDERQVILENRSRKREADRVAVAAQVHAHDVCMPFLAVNLCLRNGRLQDAAPKYNIRHLASASASRMQSDLSQITCTMLLHAAFLLAHINGRASATAAVHSCLPKQLCV